MAIGTDKPPRDILEKYNFHLADFVEPGERYTAFDFTEDARRIISQSLDKGRIPLICGGTGLYIKSLVEGMVEIDDDDLTFRKELEETVISKGPKYLFERLQKIDPKEAAKTHPNNIKRIIRALEIFLITGKTKSELLYKSQSNENLYDYEIICLMPPREELYRRINERVDLMVKSGLMEEIEEINKLGLKSRVEKINVIGYKELFRHFDGELGLDEAVNLVKQNSRRFAKRQITWFKGMKNVSYLETAEAVFEHLINYWQNKNN
jgi:tRNA dimethylallyltransferase